MCSLTAASVFLLLLSVCLALQSPLHLAVFAPFLVGSLVAPLVCLLRAIAPSPARLLSSRVVLIVGGAASVLLPVSELLLPGHSLPRLLFAFLFLGTLIGVPSCAACTFMLFRKRRYQWGIAVLTIGMLAALLVGPMVIPFSWGPKPLRYWAVLWWDRIGRDNCYILAGPEAIPYTVAGIREGNPRSEWYAIMLREILEPPKITARDTRYVRPLKRAVVDLTEISRTGNPTAKECAQKALVWMEGYAPELFPRPEG